MRILLVPALVGAGLLMGAALPSLTDRLRDALAAGGLVAGPPAHREAALSAPAGGGHAPVPSPGEAYAGHHDDGEGHIVMSAEQIAAQDIAVASAEPGILARHILVPGTIAPDADRVARVPARVVGTVSEMRKRLGDRVSKGEVVAVLDSREVADAKSEYLTAQIQADLQGINFARQQKLIASQATSEAIFQSARAAHLENQLRLDLARQKLSALGLAAADVAAAQKRDEASPTTSTLRQYELRAPVEGQIVERKVDVGTAVGKEGEPADLYTVADLSQVWIELSVPTAILPGVKEGAAVAVLPGRDGTARRAEGRVIFVSPLLNPDTRAARVVVALPNGDGAWRPGTYVTAEIEIGRDPVAVRVPKAALQTVEGRTVVFVRTEEGFEKREVDLGRADDEAVEIVSGLKAGEAIVVANSFLLKAELGKSDAGHDH
ncbi:efflux RND transporter periplasmic adaptor subunit [Methylobacterium aerolatum]|uniref:Cobalt-zinc-cadmium efflux system membrane fusion protein n=1 Tax=Methylobacterium aerolatum TaxID=418708 RepID=A0ABU0I6I7_9HYPH|nr:efflux RND transporter periplasmic adaptor subunit [Methylobacterium aerolatum]MDQ0449500.1 cobalt-zinc-cadmium efflux system membrane fusion protein [Methylobacterium aerolatum]GJD33531.1 Cobalt-zinc-cadmium resistance protein CzcB [Methylobacterium aerolatum]